MLAIVMVTFAAELVLMLALGRLADGAGPPHIALLDAALLSLFIAPPVYLLVLRPLRKEYERRLEAERRAASAGRLAMTDSLTGVLNRRGIKAGLLEAMAQADRYGRPLSVAMLDLDGFKLVNDAHGHSAGDEVLRKVVALVHEGLRGPDRLGRFGGDEFLLVLPETPLDAARKLTDRITALLRRTDFEVDHGRLHLSASIGATEFERAETLEALLARVDRELYRAKSAHRHSSRAMAPA